MTNANHQRRKRVVVIPDMMPWILGAMSLEIARSNSNHCDILIYPSDEIRSDPARFQSIVSEFDVVHVLSEYEYSYVREVVEDVGPGRPSLIATVNHIIDAGKISECFCADRVMVVCAKYRDEVIARGVLPENVFIFRLGVDTDVFHPLPRSDCRSRLGLPSDAFIMGLSGNASTGEGDRKGMAFFGDVLRVLSRGAASTIHLQTVGRSWHEFAEAWKDLGVQVHNSGFVTSKMLPLHYNAVDVHLTTSVIEGGPVPLLEAMSCEVPVITTPVGTALDVIVNGVNSLMVEHGDVEGYADAIDRLRTDPVLARELGRAGRRTIVSDRQWMNTARDAGPIYDSCELRDVGDSLMSARSISSLSRRLVARDRLRCENRFAGRESLYNAFRRLSQTPGRVPGVLLRKIRNVFTQ